MHLYHNKNNEMHGHYLIGIIEPMILHNPIILVLGLPVDMRIKTNTINLGDSCKLNL